MSPEVVAVSSLDNLQPASSCPLAAGRCCRRRKLVTDANICHTLRGLWSVVVVVGRSREVAAATFALSSAAGFRQFATDHIACDAGRKVLALPKVLINLAMLLWG